MSTEKEVTELENELGPAPKKKEMRGFASLLGKLDSASESGLQKVLFNMPFVLFLVLLAALRIASNHMAENYARRISKTEKEVRQLRWQYMTTTSDLMLKSKQSEVAKVVSRQGIMELTTPPYKIETNHSDWIAKNN